MDEDVSLVKMVKAPRICVMIREESGYGFNLHGEKGVVGQYISAVDEGGAAEKSGLLVDDRVIEVNGINVEAMSHSEVVNCIRGDPNQATLLVVDKITDSYLKNINRPVTASMASYTSVHEMIVAEKELNRLNDLNMTDQADSGDAERNPAEDEENLEQVDSDQTASNENTVSSKEQVQPPSEETGPSPSEDTLRPSEDIPPPTEDTPTPVPEDTSPPTIEEMPPATLENEQPPREETPPPSENAPSPPCETTPPLPRQPTPPLPTSSTSQQAEQPSRASPPPIRTPSPATQEPSPTPSKEDSPRKLSKKEAIKKILAKPPKRKEVKETHTDWRTKLNEFNNL